jgi:hypothetical protein
VKVTDIPTGQVIRTASTTLDVRHHTATVRYHLWRLADGARAEAATEAHTMRYFFPLELELFLSTSGFELVRLGSFPELAVEPTESTWNVGVVARAI